MNITYLNTWVGKKSKEYESFLVEKSKTEDIFCFQEIISSQLEGFTGPGLMLHQWELTTKILKDFVSFHAIRQYDWYDHEVYIDIKEPVNWGNGIFVHKSIPVLEYREKFILGHQNSGNEKNIEKTMPVVIQALKVKKNTGDLWIINFHGYFAGKGVGKGDSSERLLQSKELVAFIQELSGEVILGGDFNLNPDTESIKIIEQAPLINLISKYGIQTTRTSLYPTEKKELWPHADYVFMNAKVDVIDFTVDVDSHVSDHAPIFIKIK